MGKLIALFCGMLLTGTIPAVAQQPKEPISPEKQKQLETQSEQHRDSTSTDNTGFDATQEIFSKRYRHPDAVPFDTLWKNNVYISLFGGMDKMVPRGSADFSTGPIGGIAANWQFAPSHTVRASLLAGNLARKIDNETLRRFGLQLDYLLNVTTYTSGYNPGRLFEFLTVAGIGYQYSSLAGNAEHVGELHLGIQLKLHPTAQVDFFIEPRFTVLSDGIDHSFQKNWHKYDMTYGAIVGMNYRFKAWKPFGKIRTLEGDKFTDNTFISFAAGGQIQASRLTDEIGLTNSIGPHFSLSVGKWLIPAFGLRLSGFKSADTWHKKVLVATETTPQEEFYEMSTYMGGRLEGMLDATYFFNGRQTDPKFSINLLAGGELGLIRKESGYHPAKGGYMGITGGVQLKYKLFNDVSLFIEPRTTMASYSLKTNEKVENRYLAKKYTDNLFNINIGIEIRRSNEESRMARSLSLEDFKPSFFVSGSAGFTIPVEPKRYELKRHFNYQAMLAAGRIFTPISSARVAVDFSPLSVDMKGGAASYNMVSGSVDYLLNLSNLMMGFDAERKYDVQLLAGLVASMRLAPSDEVSDEDMNKSKLFMGGELGVQTSYKVSSRFKVFLEPLIRIYGKKLLKQSSIQGTDIVIALRAGTCFSF